VLAIAVVWSAREYLAKDSAERTHDISERPSEAASSAAGTEETAVDRTALAPAEREALVPPPGRLEREVRVLDAFGEPVSDAIVVLDDGTSAGASAVTGADGLARIFSEPSHVSNVEHGPTAYVRATGAYLVSRELAPDEQTTIVRLPDGAELSGRLAVAGGAPGESVRLALALDHPVFDGPIPPAVLAHFGTARRAIVSTGADGSFCFRGLDPRWSGTLELPKTWRLAGSATPAYGGPKLRFEHQNAASRSTSSAARISGSVLTSGASPAAQA
jgi:hypothetical protein